MTNLNYLIPWDINPHNNQASTNNAAAGGAAQYHQQRTTATRSYKNNRRGYFYKFHLLSFYYIINIQVLIVRLSGMLVFVFILDVNMNVLVVIDFYVHHLIMSFVLVKMELLKFVLYFPFRYSSFSF